MESKLGVVTHTSQEQFWWIKVEDIKQLIDEVLLNRRRRINELRSEETIAHLHTFVNHFEDELKAKIAALTDSQGVKK